MHDEQTPAAVAGIPPIDTSEPSHVPFEPSAPPAAPAEASALRPEMLALQAISHLLRAVPTLPALELTVLPHGAVVGQVPTNITPTEAEYTFRVWGDMLMGDPGAMYRESDRYDGPWHWLELCAEVPISARPGSRRLPLTVRGRTWPVTRPLWPGIPSQRSYI